MKLYDFKGAPNPRRVRMFMAEKGISMPTEQVDLMAREQHEDAFRTVNPWCTLPVLELDDGTHICEAMTICRYLEATQPEPSLMGTTPLEQATISMWEHKLEIDAMLAVGEVLRNSVDRFAGRALPGPVDHEQIPALAERGRRRIAYFMNVLDERLGESEHVAGPDFSVADITALVAVDFAARVEDGILNSRANVKRWYESVSARPSAQA
jgi:glutathione S-transferase